MNNKEQPKSKYWDRMVDIVDEHFPKGEMYGNMISYNKALELIEL